MIMKFYKNLYVGDTVKNPEKVKWKLKHRAGQMNIYVIAFAEGSDQLEFYHCAFLKQKYYRKHAPYIIGIANGREEAVEIVERIAMECFKAGRGGNLKDYLRRPAVLL